MNPSARFSRGSADDATTSATGFPNRVMRTGRFVFLTCSRTAKQVALNFEIGISFMGVTLTWSKQMVNSEDARPKLLRWRLFTMLTYDPSCLTL